IQSLMDHQEKLHLTLGRKRRLASIGVHDLSTLAPPFKVKAVDRDHRFVPLAMNSTMSVQQILDSHPKGIEYAHLLDGMDLVPIIEDAVGRTLSFPPIINGSHTTVKDTTTDFMSDVTGWDERACEASLLLVCLSLAERGGIIESMNLTTAEGENLVSPNGKPRRHILPERLLERILGGKIESEVIQSALERMGGKLIETRTATEGPLNSNRWGDASVGEKIHIIEMPRWRFDILHPIDIVEEIATGIGYESLGEAHSSLALEGVPLTRANLIRRINESLSSQGIQQVQSLTLSNDSSQFKNMRWKEQGEVTRISNPITIEHTILRQNILPSLMEILAENRHHELPQRIQECGEVVRDHRNSWRVAWACAETNAGFTAAKGIAQALIRDLGAREDISFEPLDDNIGPWIPGRGAKILIRDIELGTFGEIDPQVSEIYGLKVPIHAGEFDLLALAKAIPDPLI
ncbi:MAG: phenylalanine--tRNA ligase subunit beta, partial [Candidatus Thermoplasmatota archaeon]|nr:phenylalanine--tRNA ligase subunit beta [Candidatus Thermoplasmatota archaeon]